MTFVTSSCKYGFTLAELLIALSILGLIASFTIPKLLLNQRLSTYNASAHEAASMISGAYQVHSGSGSLSSNTAAADLTQYFNYVKVTTSGTIDDRPGAASLTCSSTAPCFVLHNGAILQPEDSAYFGGTATTNYIGWAFDPDGVYTGNADSLKLYLYYNGRLVDRNNVVNGSKTSGNGSSINSCTTCTPSWFTW